LFRRAEFLATYPIVSAMLADAKAGQYGRGDAHCVVPLRCHFDGVAYAGPVNPDLPGALIIFSLPDVFEPFLVDILTTGPMAFNWTRVDELQNTSYVRWWAEMGGAEGEGDLCVWMEAAVFHHILGLDGRDWEREEGAREFEPIVMMAGDTVAVGGVWKDAELAMELQSAGMSAQNYRPWDHHSDEALQDAKELAEQIGTRPWTEKLWRFEKGMWPRMDVIAPTALNCLDWVPVRTDKPEEEGDGRAQSGGAQRT
jgi:hypothetical protein